MIFKFTLLGEYHAAEGNDPGLRKGESFAPVDQYIVHTDKTGGLNMSKIKQSSVPSVLLWYGVVG